MACDVLKAVSEGAQKPTRVMYSANLTWPLTLGYLETLLRHQLIQRDDQGGAYRLTPKGSTLLVNYSTLLEEAQKLELHKIDPKMIRTASPAAPPSSAASAEWLRTKLKEMGESLISAQVKGRSGAEHAFDAVTSKPGGIKTGYIVSEAVEDTGVISAFLMQLDCEMEVRVVCREYPVKSAIELASIYGLKLVSMGDLGLAKNGQR